MKFFRYEYKEKGKIEVGYFNLDKVISVRGCSQPGTLSVKLDGAKTTVKVANAPEVADLLAWLEKNS